MNINKVIDVALVPFKAVLIAVSFAFLAQTALAASGGHGLDGVVGRYKTGYCDDPISAQLLREDATVCEEPYMVTVVSDGLGASIATWLTFGWFAYFILSFPQVLARWTVNSGVPKPIGKST